MAIISALLTDINLRYRNTFTDAQKVVWMNEEQEELFEIFEIDSSPYTFLTVANTNIYPIPTGLEIEKIKVMTLQINENTPPEFVELPFKRNDNKQQVYEWEYFFTIIQNNFYINVPGKMVAYRTIYIYADTSDIVIDPNVLTVEPATPVKYQELLKIGTLKRIAAARKDTLMKNNYEADYDQKMQDFLWNMKMGEPEFQTPIDVMPSSRRNQGSTVSNIVSFHQ